MPQLIVKRSRLGRAISRTREVKAHDLSRLASAGWQGYDQSSNILFLPRCDGYLRILGKPLHLQQGGKLDDAIHERDHASWMIMASWGR